MFRLKLRLLPAKKKRIPVVPYALGIIKQDLRTTLEREWDVQARKMHDNPNTLTKGNTYLVSDDWVLYMRRLMPFDSWFWWIAKEFMLMINRPSKWGSGTEEPAFECIALPCNFVAMDSFTETHARVVSRDSRKFPALTLDTKTDNWFYKPWEFWMCTMHQLNGQVRLVGSSLYVYTPVIRQRPEQWILYKDIPNVDPHKAQWSAVEIFPALPMDVTYEGKIHQITGYCLKGASVYGHAEELDIPLRLARIPGELIHPCPEWKLDEVSVPPEVRPEWR